MFPPPRRSTLLPDTGVVGEERGWKERPSDENRNIEDLRSFLPPPTPQPFSFIYLHKWSQSAVFINRLTPLDVGYYGKGVGGVVGGWCVKNPSEELRESCVPIVELG